MSGPLEDVPFEEDVLFEFCRSLPGAAEDVKWGDNLVFSVAAKMFAVFQLPDGQPISFKVEPLVFASLTEHEGIVPAPYLARHGWVQVQDRAVMPAENLQDFIAESHRLVVSKLPKKVQRELEL